MAGIGATFKTMQEDAEEVLPAAPHRFDATCSEVARELGADACVIRLLSGNDLELAGAFGVPSEMLPLRMPREYGLANQLLSLERPLVIADVRAYPITRRITSSKESYRFEFISFAGIPIMRGGVPLGVMAIYTVKALRLFTDRDVDRLLEIGGKLSEEI